MGEPGLVETSGAAAPALRGNTRPTTMQRRWLRRGLTQAGGKLPLFDRLGQRVSERTVRACLDQGWAEPWFANPLNPDWLVCKLTDSGRKVAAEP
jgi:hypothetical protein